MRRVYVAAYPIEGELVRIYLEANRIQAVVLTAYESESTPTVWVLNDEDESDARELIEQRSKDAESLPPWQCGVCEEENEGPFGVCWKCGAAAPPLPG